MGDVEKIFRIDKPTPHSFSNPSRQSIEATEDYAVKKVMNTLEGTIEKVPVNDNDIANKAYVDSVVGTASAIVEGSDILSTGEAVTKWLRADGDGTSSWQTLPAAGAVAWGDITGTVSNQTDLQTALDSKVGSTSYNTHVGSTSIHFLKSSIDHTGISNIGTNTHAQIDTHIASTAIHFTKSSISHTAISDIGTNTHAQLDTHVSSTAIHYTKASISHTDISDIGTNTHAQLDTHVSSTAIHYTKASIDHTGITNIGTNSHSAIDTHIGSTAIHYTQSSITSLGSGAVALDHGTGTTDMIVNVCYGTSATPPTASNTTEGTIYIQYTA